jgi:hypothetical protein
METFTPGGMAIGFLPIRDISALGCRLAAGSAGFQRQIVISYRFSVSVVVSFEYRQLTTDNRFQ